MIFAVCDGTYGEELIAWGDTVEEAYQKLEEMGRPGQRPGRGAEHGPARRPVFQRDEDHALGGFRPLAVGDQARRAHQLAMAAESQHRGGLHLESGQIGPQQGQRMGCERQAGAAVVGQQGLAGAGGLQRRRRLMGAGGAQQRRGAGVDNEVNLLKVVFYTAKMLDVKVTLAPTFTVL